MSLKWSSFFLYIFAALPAAAQLSAPPRQQDILQAMRLANSYFMTKWPDPGQQIVTNIARPSHIWTRAVYYEGLMGLYSIDPKKEYYDYAVDWGVKHQWMPNNGVNDRNADDQCTGQTWIRPLPHRLPAPNASGISRIASTAWSIATKPTTGIGSTPLQMAMPVFTRETRRIL